MTSLADASSICTPRKMIRSSKSLLYGFISSTPYDVRSTKRREDVAAVASVLTPAGLSSLTWFSSSLRQDRRPPRAPAAALRDDVVDEAVVLGLLGGEPAVAVGVGLDLLERLAGVEGDALGETSS